MFAVICGSSEKETKAIQRIVTRFTRDKGRSAQTEILHSGRELIFKWEDHFRDIELLVLEADLPDMSGIETAKHIRMTGFEGDLILYAKDTSKAPDGYDVDALGYVIIGADAEEKFDKILRKTGRTGRNKDREVLVFSRGRENRYITAEEITYFEIRGRIVTVHYGTGESFDFYAKMKDLEEELSEKGFVRTHKSYLVREKCIRRMRAREVLLTDDTRLHAGQSYIAAIRRKKEYLS